MNLSINQFVNASKNIYLESDQELIDVTNYQILRNNKIPN